MIQDLRQQGIECSEDPVELLPVSRGLWPYQTLLFAKGNRPSMPKIVAWPKSSEDISTLIRFAHDRHLPIVPYGGGSGVCGAVSNVPEGLVVDMKCMNKVLHLDPEAKTVSVQAGILGVHLENILESHGFKLGHSPSSIMTSTIGGYVATRSAGQFSSMYGTFDDMLLGATTCLKDQRLQCGEWATGHDYLPVLSGSEGALGIIDTAVMRIHSLPKHRWLRGFAFPNLQTAWQASRRLMQADLRPLVLRVYDPIDSRIGNDKHGVWLETVKDWLHHHPMLRGLLLRIPLALPRLVNRLAKTAKTKVLMILGYEGSVNEIEYAKEVSAHLLTDATDLGEGPGFRWYKHRHDVSYKLAPFFMCGGFADTMEVACPWSQLEQLHENLRTAIGTRALVMAHFSHAYPEGCSIYFSFAGLGNPQTYNAIWQDALTAVVAANCVVTHHHGVGQLKSQAASLQQGHALRTWWDIKQRLDPQNIFNPSRPFQAQPALGDGPPSPSGGPIFSCDQYDSTAWINPHISTDKIARKLAAQGIRLMHQPKQTYINWVQQRSRREIISQKPAFFGIQARFADGKSVCLRPTPRSAGGPDLRYELLANYNIEQLQVPIRPLFE